MSDALLKAVQAKNHTLVERLLKDNDDKLSIDDKIELLDAYSVIEGDTLHLMIAFYSDYNFNIDYRIFLHIYPGHGDYNFDKANGTIEFTNLPSHQGETVKIEFVEKNYRLITLPSKVINKAKVELFIKRPGSSSETKLEDSKYEIDNTIPALIINDSESFEYGTKVRIKYTGA